jgi:hypothetical protein
MRKLSGTYTIKTADRPGEEGQFRGTILTVEVMTGSPDDAAAAAEALGHELDKLGLTFPAPASK